jgi:ABC-type sugar transport system substrate-binding protein
VNQPTWEPRHPSRLRVAVVGALLVGIIGIASMPVARASPGPPGKVTICHATGSASNPFVQITISENAAREGRAHNRDGHQASEDIIPPGPYDPDGRNWDPARQTIYDEGCLTFAPDILPPSL